MSTGAVCRQASSCFRSSVMYVLCLLFSDMFIPYTVRYLLHWRWLQALASSVDRDVNGGPVRRNWLRQWFQTLNLPFTFTFEKADNFKEGKVWRNSKQKGITFCSHRSNNVVLIKDKFDAHLIPHSYHTRVIWKILARKVLHGHILPQWCYSHAAANHKTPQLTNQHQTDTRLLTSD